MSSSNAFNVLLALAITSFAPSVHAQACCTGTSGEDFAVVRRCAHGIVAAQLSYERSTGSFDSSSRYRPLRNASVEAGVLVLGGGARLFPDTLQINATLPLRLQRRKLDGLAPATRAGVGDATATLRWTAISDQMIPLSVFNPESLVPFVDLYAGARFPTGASPEASEEPTGADVMGTGAWTPFVGVKVSKFFGMSHVVSADVRYARPLAHRVASPTGGSREVKPGDELTLRAAWLYLHDLRWSGGPFAELALTTAPREDGKTVANADARRTRAGAHVAYVFDYPDWELSFGLASDLLWNGPSKNVPYAGPSASLGVSRQFR